MSKTVEEILANIDWTQNIGKFKVGDIIGGYEEGFWKIIEIDRRKGYSLSGEAHIVASYNPRNKKAGKAKFSWCSYYSKPASQEIERQKKVLQKKISELKKELKDLASIVHEKT